MPDESTAAEEHAILQEVTAPLATLPDDPMQEVADVQFPIVLRGYDRLAVDAYVKRTSQLVAELQATRSPEAAVRRGLERVGEEVSGILQRAHDAASQITAQSRSEAEDRLERAPQAAAVRFPAADDPETTVEGPGSEEPETEEPQGLESEAAEPEAAGPEALEAEEPDTVDTPNGLVEESGDPDDAETTRVMRSIPPPEEGEFA